jgi:hypothetical protein
MTGILSDMGHPSAKAVGMRGYIARNAKHAGGLGGEHTVEENCL